MPVSASLAQSNRTQTERLKRLVGRLNPDMLAVRLDNGWTVAVALGHLAFWDRARGELMRRWAAGEECTGDYAGNVFNDAMRPFLEMIPPVRAGAIAVQAAEEVDALLLALPDDVVAAALARPDAPNLDRGSHRAHHLDLVEKALAGAGHSSGQPG